MNTKIGDFVKICRAGGVLSKNKFRVVATHGNTIMVRKDSPTSWMVFSPTAWVRVAAPVRQPGSKSERLHAMKSRRHVRMFMPRFAPLVEAGTKPTTIRPTPKREIKVGDVLDLRAWTGKPYRSKQRKLREAYCTAVTPIELCFIRHRLLVWLRGAKPKHLSTAAIETMARLDGFSDAAEMADWFDKMHGLPFAGVLIEWQP